MYLGIFLLCCFVKIKIPLKFSRGIFHFPLFRTRNICKVNFSLLFSRNIAKQHRIAAAHSSSANSSNIYMVSFYDGTKKPVVKCDWFFLLVYPSFIFPGLFQAVPLLLSFRPFPELVTLAFLVFPDYQRLQLRWYLLE